MDFFIMIYHHVCIEAVTHILPPEIVTTEEIERRLQPVYERLHLSPGRLEWMTGIRERRLWNRGTLPGTQSIQTVQKLLEKAAFPAEKIGCLIHGSVCRDYLEPATACGVHQGAGLPPHCQIFDVSNACLGLLTGVLQIANMIELGQIEAGIVVGTEDSRSLLETTLEQMNQDMTLTRQSIKPFFASLTIGSSSAALLLTHRKISRTQWHLAGGNYRANTAFCHLCRSDESVKTGDSMKTDSEQLLLQGVDTAKTLFPLFLTELGWQRENIERFFCHQVGKAHQKRLYDELELDTERDFSTLEYTGNTGSAALPTALSIGLERGICQPGDRVALLGIGSGINSVMLGLSRVHTT
ncbi:MAG: 3-oxoacyl-ACP synthase III [Planctomycetia bacterium]|nr:3-oxoacyl-ACP synthase III [Planctomycetia bacterium]